MKENILFNYLGNGVTVCDKNRYKFNDYLIVAYIGYDRTITYYETDLSEEARKKIEIFAKEDNITPVAQPHLKALKPLGYTIEFIDYLSKEWSGIAKEKVAVQPLDDDIFAYGSEIACLRLAYNMRKRSVAAGYSTRSNSWYFVLYTNKPSLLQNEMREAKENKPERESVHAL